MVNKGRDDVMNDAVADGIILSLARSGHPKYDDLDWFVDYIQDLRQRRRPQPND